MGVVFRTLSGGTLESIANGSGSAASEAARAIANRRAIISRLRLGRWMCFGLSMSAVFLGGLRENGWVFAFLSSILAALIFAFFADIASTIALRRASAKTLRLMRILRPLEWIVVPLSWPHSWATHFVERLVPTVKPTEDMIAGQVEHLIDKSAKEGALATEHVELLRNALEFKDTIAREVMVPRSRVVGFEIDTDLDTVLKKIEETGHSRYPVYRETIDNVEGILYAKDFFRVAKEDSRASLKDLIRRPAFFTPEKQKIGTLLRQMQASRFHLAVVVDEFGAANGIVTLEDILEELVGEIEDEHDEEAERVKERTPGTYVADATISIYDLMEILGDTLILEKGGYDSLGGMIVQLAGRVPEAGEEVQAGGYDLRVLEADERHVTRVEIVKRNVTQHAS